MDALIVEDEDAIRTFLAEVLLDEGWGVRAVACAEEAWSIVRASRPDVVLVDQRLPGMTGAALCRMLQTDDQTASVPVILMSALEPPGGSDQCAPAAYIAKPFTIPALLDIIQLVCAGPPGANPRHLQAG